MQTPTCISHEVNTQLKINYNPLVIKVQAHNKVKFKHKKDITVYILTI